MKGKKKLWVQGFVYERTSHGCARRHLQKVRDDFIEYIQDCSSLTQSTATVTDGTSDILIVPNLEVRGIYICRA